MRTILFFYLLILSLSSNSQTTSFDWAKQMGGTRFDVGSSITVDASGNVYTTGAFENTVDFDPGIGVSNLTSNGRADIFIQKLDANGNFLWVKQMGSTYNDRGESITVDVSGNVYTTGAFWGTVDFDPGAGVSNLTGGGAFIQKLDTNGNFLWAKQMGGTGLNRGTSTTLDASGNIYTTGFFMDTVDFDPGAGVSNLTSNGSSDIFIQKLDANGNFLWVKQMGGVNYDRGESITVDASGNVYTTGYFNFKVDFDPGAGVSNLTSNGMPDIFIQKLDLNGNFLWVKQMGGVDEDWGSSITVDVSGNVYTTGNFSLTVDFDPGAGVSILTSNGAYDIFIQKLDANGNFLWVKQMGAAGGDWGTSILDASGNVYTTGSFQYTVDFDPDRGAGISNLTSNGSSDIFIQKLDANGNFLWVKQMGGASRDIGRSITLDAFGNVYTIGNFLGTVDFDPGAGVSNLTSFNGSYGDIFIQKLRVLGVGIIENDFGTEFLIYPNPTDGNFSIDLGEKHNEASITITDLNGKAIHSKSYIDSQLLNLELEEPSGVYLLIIEAEEKKAVIRLVKE